jgi:chorismate mutase
MSESDDVARARLLLKDLRGSIDRIDAAIVYMLAERFRCTETVSRLKAEHNLPPADLTREAEQIERLRKLAEDANFNPDFAVKFLNFIIKEVIRHHEAINEGRTDADMVAAKPADIARPTEIGR